MPATGTYGQTYVVLRFHGGLHAPIYNVRPSRLSTETIWFGNFLRHCVV